MVWGLVFFGFGGVVDVFVGLRLVVVALRI